MIHVVAVITAKPGLRAQVLEFFAANRPAVLAEEGCIEYVATVDAQGMPASKGTFGEDSFAVVEKWASLDALKAHAAAPHETLYEDAARYLTRQIEQGCPPLHTDVGAFAAFNVDAGLAVVAVLAYRAFTFWLPTVPGVIAYLQLRKTVEGWRLERRGALHYTN